MALTRIDAGTITVITGTLTGTQSFSGVWKRFLVKNLDTLQSFQVQVNGGGAYTIEALTRHGDAYQDSGIRTFTLVFLGGAPPVELVLHN